MSGPINAEMLSCAETNITPEINTIRVSTFGGDVEDGHAIARLIAKQPRTLIVEDYCMSSCGNYFVPAAETVVIKPNAMVGLHGTIDPFTLEKNKVLDENYHLVEAENSFATEFGVPRGWRIYRTKGHPNQVETKDMVGRLRPATHKRTRRVVIVEPTFFQACLPHIKIVFQDGSDNPFASPKTVKKIEALGGIGSGSLACKPNTGQKDTES